MYTFFLSLYLSIIIYITPRELGFRVIYFLFKRSRKQNSEDLVKNPRPSVDRSYNDPLGPLRASTLVRAKPSNGRISRGRSQMSPTPSLHTVKPGFRALQNLTRALAPAESREGPLPGL